MRSKGDAVTVLTIFLVALFGINARWVLPGTGAIGTPAMAIAMFAAWWWLMARINSHTGIDRGPNHVRFALVGYLWFLALSWGAARLRPLTELEVSSSNRDLIAAIGLTGVALLVADGVRERKRLETLLRRIVVGASALSILGLLQFVFRIDFLAFMTFPGLVMNLEIDQALGLRSGLSRVEGTALHPIEFGIVLAIILPLAVHFAMHSPERRTRHGYAAMSAVIASGIPLSVSRSGLLAVATALLVASLAWTWRERILGLFASVFGMIVIGIAVPGLIGTFRFLTFNTAQDPSVAARLRRIPRVEEAFWETPWFGTGAGTRTPEEDFLLDNQYFETLLETGIVGLTIVLILIAIAILACNGVRKYALDRGTRYLAAALMGGIAVLPVVMATFDAFFYRILMGLAFLLIGSAGALWRMVVRGDGRLTPSRVEPLDVKEGAEPTVA